MKGFTVRENEYSHRVLCMVPNGNFRAVAHLDFVSKYTAEKVVDNITHDCLHQISALCYANHGDEGAATASLRGRIYEMLCHRYISNVVLF